MLLFAAVFGALSFTARLLGRLYAIPAARCLAD
jgi:hypothetical protein